MTTEDLRYQIIDECKCGYEELFVILGLIDSNDKRQRNHLVGLLESMVQEGLLTCEIDGNETFVTAEELSHQLSKRIAAGECLTDYPECCLEYSFMATDESLRILKEKDRPVTLE